ncbi:MAG TPA: malto-oligosyltrehalose trehalohydrolase [Bryobacteraceae bacterium]|nr:malto-oligosyltrehalose trehalohydrolase [Bryobacteraceae bacterium]
MTRRFPIGAEPQEGGTHFRLWAPARQRVEVVLESGAVCELEREPCGYFSGFMAAAAEGARYRFRLDGADSFPDPASRFQPEGPHGPSQIVDPTRFGWTDGEWRGLTIEGQVIYELHLGTFTREGTWEAARRELPELAAAGITVIEIMPVADFPGRFGWGYDGVGLFAPVSIYGTPDDFRSFVDGAHRVGLGVILDVVYNHIGPDGNYLKQYSQTYFTSKYDNEWGEALNYDGPDSTPVREWVITNAAYWAMEFHLDGLRLDATQQIFDDSPEHIVAALTRSMRDAAASQGRSVIVVAENEAQLPRLARARRQGGYGVDALWNDDFHHSAVAAVTGHQEAYFTDFLGRPQEFISSIKYGYLFQGQRYKWQAKRRGAPAWGLRPAQFVTYIENHDQIANTGLGKRLDQRTSPGRLRALTALLLLSPGTPLLFQGQEFGASSPFLFFADHNQGLRPLVREGRIQFLSQFRALAQPEVRQFLPDPGDPATFERCKLDLSERLTHAAVYSLHRDLLRLRREVPVFRAQRPGGIDGAVLGHEAFVLRYFGESAGQPQRTENGSVGDREGDRLLLVNFGLDLRLDPAPEPLLAPPEGCLWEIEWSSEDPRYGGGGTAPLDTPENWRIPGHAAVVMRPVEVEGKWAL